MMPAALRRFVPGPDRRFTLIMSSMIAAAAIHAGVALWMDVDAENEAISHQVMETSLLAAQRTGEYFQRWQAVFSALSEHDCLRRKRPETCGDLMARLNQRFPEAANFGAINREGDFFASGRPIETSDRRNVRHLPFFKSLAEGRDRVLMDPHPGPISGERVTGIAFALRDATGKFDGVFGVSTRMSQVEALLREGRPYPGINVLVVNRAGRIIHAQDNLYFLQSRTAAEVGLPNPLPEGSGPADFTFGNERYHGHMTAVGNYDWTVVAVHKAGTPLASYLASDRLGIKLFLPIALLTVAGGILALRAQRTQRRLAESQSNLKAALSRTEDEVEARTRALAGNEARYRALFEHSPNGVVIADMDGRIVEFNDHAADLLGYPVEMFAGLSIANLADGSDRDELHRRLLRVVPTGSDQFETRLRTRSGHPLGMLVSVRRIDLPSGPMLLSVWTDLTPIQRIREMQQRLQSIVEASRDAILLVGSSGRILYGNPGAERFLGWSASELSGLPVEAVIPEDQHLWQGAALEAILGGRVTVSNAPIEIEVLHRDGRRIPAELSLASWEENGQTLFGGILRDIGERRQAQDRLQFTQKMEAVGILAGGIAHDFNNLLAIMLGHGQLIQDRHPEGDPTRSSAEKINKAVLKARALIKQLLDFSRASDEAPKIMSLVEELREVESLIRLSVPKQVELRIQSSPALAAVRAVPHQIQQIFINLINNACDAIGGRRGTVEVALTEEVVDARIATADGVIPPGHYVVARVTDNGPGISEEIHDRIFLPFFTTKEIGRGTGLGLSVVRNIVRQSGGYIRVYNRLSGGACFELHFPLIESALPTAEAETPEIAGRGEPVLFVDDEPEVVEAYCEFLLQAGFAPRVLSSPQDALAELQRHPDDTRIVVSDLVMPGMDGLEFAHAIHRFLPGMPVLLLTGRGERVTQDQMKHCGVASLIAKPAEPRLLAAEIRRTLDRVGRRTGRPEI